MRKKGRGPKKKQIVEGPGLEENAEMLGLAREFDQKLIGKNIKRLNYWARPMLLAKNNRKNIYIKAELLGSAHVKHLIGPG